MVCQKFLSFFEHFSEKYFVSDCFRSDTTKFRWRRFSCQIAHGARRTSHMLFNAVFPNNNEVFLRCGGREPVGFSIIVRLDLSQYSIINSVGAWKVGFRYIAVLYNTIVYTARRWWRWNEHTPNFQLTKITPYLAFTSKLWCVYIVNCGHGVVVSSVENVNARWRQCTIPDFQRSSLWSVSMWKSRLACKGIPVKNVKRSHDSLIWNYGNRPNLRR